MREKGSLIMSMSTMNWLNRESHFLFYGQNTVPNARQSTQSRISIRSSMTSIMLMLHQRKQLSELSANPAKPWK